MASSRDSRRPGQRLIHITELGAEASKFPGTATQGRGEFVNAYLSPPIPGGIANQWGLEWSSNHVASLPNRSPLPPLKTI